MLTNYWFVGCAAKQLEDVPLPIEVQGERIVLFRKSDGTPSALKDRCCHRGMPLSKGKINGDAIACGFHGWEFNGSGKCTKIPSQLAEKEIAKVYCVPSFPCAEKDGYIWIWQGDAQPTSVSTIPEFSSNRWLQG